MKTFEKEFALIDAFITESQNSAIGYLNYAAISMYWTLGAYISARLKSAAWGSKTVVALEDYLKTRHPRTRGFGRRNLYNMVQFYDIYSSREFAAIHERLKLYEFVPSALVPADSPRQLTAPSQSADQPIAIVQSPIAQMNRTAPIVQSLIAQLGNTPANFANCPPFLALISFTNHIRIANYCRDMEEKVFYIMYSAREHLMSRELVRCIQNETYATVLSKGKRVTKALKEKYPSAEFLIKDRAFLDFLKLPVKHTEPLLRKKILDHMKDFILELGKDYLYMGNEFHVNIGGDEKRLDLLFYHRSLQCLVDVELKAVPFKPEFISKMDVYLEALDRDIRRPNENPSVGLLLCPSAKTCDVEYTLARSMSPIMVAEYRRLLIPAEVLRKELSEYFAMIKEEQLKGSVQ